MNNLCPFMSTAENEAYCKTYCKFYEADSTEPCGIKNAIEDIFDIKEQLKHIES